MLIVLDQAENNIFEHEKRSYQNYNNFDNCYFDNYDTKNVNIKDIKKSVKSEPKRFTKEKLQEFSNIEELFMRKTSTYYDTLKFEKCAEINGDLYSIHYSSIINKNKKYITLRIHYPYKEGIEDLEIHDFYYDNVLYERFAFDPRKPILHKFIKYIIPKMDSLRFLRDHYYDSFDTIYNKQIYDLIENNSSYKLVKYRYFTKAVLSNNNLYDLQKYDLNIKQQKYKFVKIDDMLIKYDKKIYHPFVEYEYYNDLVELTNYKDEYTQYKKIIRVGNMQIIEYGTCGSFVRKFVSFFSSKGKKRKVSQIYDQNNKEEVDIDGDTNKALRISIKGKDQNLDDIIGYKIAKINYKNEYKSCIIEVKIPKDAKIASDGSGKYRCNKLIPKEIYIAVENGIKKIGKDELKGLYCESSVYTSGFKYYIDQLCEETKFDPDLHKVCTHGLHYCLNMEHAINTFGYDFNKDNLNIIEDNTEDNIDDIEEV